MILSVSENLSINIFVDNYTELEDFQPCFNQQTHSVLGSVSEISPTPSSLYQNNETSQTSQSNYFNFH